MGQIDVELFEAFKSLEKICNEIYGQNKGVSLYITDMENTSIYEANKIQGWDVDLKRLKKCISQAKIRSIAQRKLGQFRPGYVPAV